MEGARVGAKEGREAVLSSLRALIATISAAVPNTKLKAESLLKKLSQPDFVDLLEVEQLSKVEADLTKIAGMKKFLMAQQEKLFAEIEPRLEVLRVERTKAIEIAKKKAAIEAEPPIIMHGIEVRRPKGETRKEQRSIVIDGKVAQEVTVNVIAIEGAEGKFAIRLKYGMMNMGIRFYGEARDFVFDPKTVTMATFSMRTPISMCPAIDFMAS